MSARQFDRRNPMKHAKGLGSAKDGTHHFIVQRISAVALVFLVPWLVWLVLNLLHADYATAHATLAQPVNAVLLSALLLMMFWHARLGLQVVIEDYVHGPAMNIIAQLLVWFACSLGALVSLVAIGRILFAA
ncbi:MAG: succinate dehydrogenase, hydrophobic membrane anchor protein [Xanthomonadales bacterium]|nr:succinate dehydrogenase, hydrophobic membrane anchor protein [Xanthomonadales bacterium]